MNRTTPVQSSPWFSSLAAIRAFVAKSRGIGWEQRPFGAGRVALLIGAFLLALYPDVFQGTHSMFYRDFGFFTYPLAHYHKEAFWKGEIPLWNPLSNCGIPYLAQWNTIVLYPLSLIYLLLPLPWSLNLFCFAHQILGGVGMYLLVRRHISCDFGAVIAAVAYSCNGLVFHVLMWTNNIAGLAWMPFVVGTVELACERGGRWVLVATGVAALQVLAGAPEIILFTWVITAVWLVLFRRQTETDAASTRDIRPGIERFVRIINAISRSALGRLGMVLLLAGGLTAVQTLPFLDLLAHSQRNRSFAVADWAMPPWGWVNFFVPLFRCTPSVLGVFSQDEQQWTASYYLGLLPLLLAALAMLDRRKETKVLMAIALTGVFLALGKSGYIYSVLARTVPIMGIIRYPMKFIYLTAFAIPVLAGYGLNYLNEARPGRRPIRPILIIGSAFLVVIGSAMFVAKHWPFAGDSVDPIFRSGLSRVWFLAASLGLLALFCLRARSRFVSGLGLAIVLGVDLLSQAPRINPTVAIEAYQPLDLAMSSIPRAGTSRVLLRPELHGFLDHAALPDALEYFRANRRSLFLECNLMEGVPATHGFFSLYLKEEAELRRALWRRDRFPALMDLMAVSQISSPDEPGRWEARADFLPMISSGQQPIFEEPAATFRRLNDRQLRPDREVCLPTEAKSRVSANAGEATIGDVRFGSQLVEFGTKSAQPAMVVISQAYYHPWRAFVDGKPVQLWRANYAFQSLEVPSGNHSVQLRYVDWSFRIGALISIGTLIVMVLVLGYQIVSSFKTRFVSDSLTST